MAEEGEDKKQLDELPKDDTTETYRVKPSSSCGRGLHSLVQISGREVKCSVCNTGYEITPGSYIENGHMYFEKTLIA